MKNIPRVRINPTDTSQPVMVENVVRKQQCQTEWCWAACAQMALAAGRQPAVCQCEMANRIFNKVKCCDEPGSSGCNNGCKPDQVTDLYDKLNIHVNPRQPLPVPTAGGDVQNIIQMILNEIPEGNAGARRPVEIHFEVGGGSHVVMVTGWARDDQNGLRFFVIDPWRQRDSRMYNANALSTLAGSVLGGNSIIKWANMWTGIQPKQTKNNGNISISGCPRPSEDR